MDIQAEDLSSCMLLNDMGARSVSSEGLRSGVPNGLGFSVSVILGVESRPVPLRAAAVSALTFIGLFFCSLASFSDSCIDMVHSGERARSLAGRASNLSVYW